MWQKLLNTLIQASWVIFTASAFSKTVRMFIGALLAGLTVWHSDKWMDLIGRALYFILPLQLTVTFAEFRPAYELANAWLPIDTMFICITGLWTFRAAFAGLKVLEHAWDAVPFQ
jgi:hypothetical protein